MQRALSEQESLDLDDELFGEFYATARSATTTHIKPAQVAVPPPALPPAPALSALTLEEELFGE